MTRVTSSSANVLGIYFYFCVLPMLSGAMLRRCVVHVLFMCCACVVHVCACVSTRGANLEVASTPFAERLAFMPGRLVRGNFKKKITEHLKKRRAWVPVAA